MRTTGIGKEFILPTLKNVRYLKTVNDHVRLGECIAEIAFVGRSNVGKSSVISACCGEKNLARTSRIPGKTRAISVFAVAHGRWIIDLPGYGYATGSPEERSTWPEMIEGYLKNRPALRMVFVIVDAKVGPTKLDRQMVFWLQSNSIPLRIVINKSDKISVPGQAERRKAIALELECSEENVFWVSAAKGTGIRELAREASRILEPGAAPSGRGE
jgi:GTP-binding protein